MREQPEIVEQPGQIANSAPPARLRVVEAVAAAEAPPAAAPLRRRRRVTASKDTAQFFDQPKEHSIVKTSIVAKYFPAWANIMKTRVRSGKMAYFDLFSGPGRYDDGTPSTPIKIIESAIANPILRDQVIAMFCDESPECVEALKANLAALPGIETLKFPPRVTLTNAAQSGLDKYFATQSIIPCYMFLDPFGYAGVTSKLIHAILKDWGCDVVFFFCFKRMPGAIMNNKVRSHMDELFGHDRVDQLRAQLRGMKARDKEPVILKALEESLNAIGGRYIQTFRFRSVTGAVTHHLVFVTKHPTAHYIMKGIMAKESTGHTEDVANFEFQTNAPQSLFATYSPIEDLMASLLSTFRGRTISISDIIAEHQYGKPYIGKNYQEALKRLCYDRGAVTAKRGPLRPALKPEKRDMPLEETFITFPA